MWSIKLLLSLKKNFLYENLRISYSHCLKLQQLSTLNSAYQQCNITSLGGQFLGCSDVYFSCIFTHPVEPLWFCGIFLKQVLTPTSYEIAVSVLSTTRQQYGLENDTSSYWCIQKSTCLQRREQPRSISKFFLTSIYSVFYLLKHLCIDILISTGHTVITTCCRI